MAEATPAPPPTGVGEIDREHALELRVVREIQAALLAGDRQRAKSLLERLEAFTEAHFLTEQLLMRQHAYPGYEAHQQEHDRLIGELRDLRRALEAGRAGAGFTVRVRLAVLALMRAQDVHEAVTQELPALLGVETCTLAVEAAPAPVFAFLPLGVRSLPPGTVGRLIGRGRDAVVRQTPGDLSLLHGEAAPLVLRDALARVPLAGPNPALIAIGARDTAALPMRQTVAVLAFLGRAVAAALSR